MAKSDPVFRQQLVTECETLVAANQPAHVVEVAGLVRRLMNHYRATDLTEADLQGIVEDWIEDLSDMPFDILRDAMSSYRQSAKARFKPLAGDIIELARANAGFRMKLAERAGETLAMLSKDAA